MKASAGVPQLYGRQLVLVVAAFSIVLVRLSVLTGHQTVIAPAVLLVFLLCIWRELAHHSRLKAHLTLFTVLVYVGWTDIAIVRGSEAGVFEKLSHAVSESLTYAALVAIGCLLVTSSRSLNERRQRIVAIALAPGVYALVNALLHIAGAKAATVDASQQGIATLQAASLLKLFHIYINRVQFPMATGVNSTGIVAGAGLASCLILARTRSAPRWVTWPCVAGCLYCLLLGDNRVSLAAGLAAAIYFSQSRRATAARLLPIVVPLLPLLVVLGISLSEGFLGQAFSRGGSPRNFASAGNRLYIWEAAWNVLRHPSIEQLYGWGANGQISSGLSKHYAYLFASLPHPFAYSTHDIVIQTIFDGGYVGLIILVAAVWVTTTKLIRHIRRDPTSLASALMAMLTVTLLSGATEVSPSYGTQEALVVALLVMGAAAGLSLPSVEQPRLTLPGASGRQPTPRALVATIR